MVSERNYARFYAILKRMPRADKESLVYIGTGGRTTHLHETTPAEYDAMCKAMERSLSMPDKSVLKRKRSLCLKLMQQMGVYTADWPSVDRFCMDKRIAGKRFRHIDEKGLEQLSKKLRAILSKTKNEAIKDETFCVEHKHVVLVLSNESVN